MSRLIASILLSIFIFPLSAIVYMLAWVLILKPWTSLPMSNRDIQPFVGAGVITSAFVAVYWVLLWRSSVRWNQPRVVKTVLAGVGGGMIGLILYIALTVPTGPDMIQFAAFVGSVVAPMTWLVSTVLIWRETPAERADRTRTGSGLVCPTCGYNLTGLTTTRCPECGTSFTLDQLLHNQPGREAGELESRAGDY